MISNQSDHEAKFRVIVEVEKLSNISGVTYLRDGGSKSLDEVGTMVGIQGLGCGDIFYCDVNPLDPSCRKPTMNEFPEDSVSKKGTEEISCFGFPACFFSN